MKKEIVIEIFNDILDLEMGLISDNSSPEDFPEWDSMANVNIMLALEEKFNIKFNLDDIEDAKNVSDFINLVDKYTQ